MNSKFTIVSVAVAALLGLTTAWKAESHVIIARMGYDLLQENNPAALKKATKLLKSFSNSKGFYIEKEDKYPFVECATYGDDIRHAGGAYQANWHFVDNPLIQNGKSISDYPDFEFTTLNATLAIPQLIHTLKGSSGWDQTDVYTAIRKYQDSDNDAKSIALRLLIHYIGDIHQPMHALSRITDENPAGDRGGNEVKLPGHYGAANLHAVWDSVIYEFHESVKLPFISEDWSAIGAFATTLSAAYSISQADQTNTDFNGWGLASFQIGADNAYNGVEEDEKLSDEYIDTCKPLAEKQIVLAGHRLYHIISDIFSGEETVATEAFLQ